jgi:TetR/AcrR family transcriptional repressor of nem operon
MGRPTLAESRDTRAELLEAAMELLQTIGFNAFSYQDLADRLDIKKASIHYHFPTKEDLAIGLIERSVNRFQAWSETIDDQDLSPSEKLQAYFEYFVRVYKDGKRICPCGQLVAEWRSLPEKLQEMVMRLLQSHKQWLTQLLEKGRKSGEFVKLGTATEQAEYVYSSIQGALQTSRALQSVNTFQTHTKHIANAIKA